MKEYIFKFCRYSYFMQEDQTGAVFGEDRQVRLILEPVEYELQMSGAVLNKVSCKGYIIDITNTGAVRFCDYAGALLAEKAAVDKEFKEFRLQWKDSAPAVSFGYQETVDNYPNCDGEYDRWSTRWAEEYNAAL